MTTAMLRLVRHKKTRAYLSKDGSWTNDPAAAEQFADIASILKLQNKLELTEIEMVLQMGFEPCSEYDITLPLRDP